MSISNAKIIIDGLYNQNLERDEFILNSDGTWYNDLYYNLANADDLADVAFTGSYNDLSDKPTIDSSLSFSSTNAVENQAITNTIYDKNSSDDRESGVNIEFSNPTLNPYVHIGSKSSATKGNSSVGIGYNAESSAIRSVAIGPSSKAASREGVALGANATAGQYSLSIGYYTNTVPNYSTAVGPYAKVLTGATNATAIGYQSEADESETISVGKSTNRRRIVNVADGTTATDAATVGQIPTKTSDLTNDGADGSSTYATTADLPTVNNATLTIQKNGTNVQTFTANQSSNATANITVPTKTSDLTNDSNFPTDSSYVHTDNNFTTTLKNKLDGIASGAEVNQNAFSNIKVGSTTVAADSKTDTLELTAGTNITLTPDATNDKVTIATSAEVNQNAFSNVKVGSTTIAADAKTDTLELVAGSNVTLTPDATNDKVTIAATDTTYSNFTGATSSAAGSAGLVPAPASGDTSKYLKSDGTWATVQSGSTYTAGDHIDITNNTISAVDYVHSDDPVTTGAITPVVTNSMVATGTLTSDKFASGELLTLTMSTTDIGEGAPLAANTLYGVYE